MTDNTNDSSIKSTTDLASAVTCEYCGNHCDPKTRADHDHLLRGSETYWRELASRTAASALLVA